MIRTGLRRGRRSTKRLDVADLRHALRDGRQWCYFGLVTKPPDADSHFRIVRRDGKVVDVLVEVETMPTRQDLTCRLESCAGGPGAGLWRIPPVGAEVVVVLPEGALDFMPTIVGILGSGDAPGRVAADRTILVAPDRIEIIAPDVRLGDGDASHPVGRGDALEAKLNSLIDKHNTHTHGGVTTGGGTSGLTAMVETPSTDGQSSTVRVP